MSDSTFSREQAAALEKILGVKLPEQGFTLEIKPVGSGDLDDAQLEGVVGGTGIAAHAAPLQQHVGVGVPQLPMLRWSCKI